MRACPEEKQGGQKLGEAGERGRCQVAKLKKTEGVAS